MAQEQFKMLLEQLQSMNLLIQQNSIKHQLQQSSLNNGFAQHLNSYQSFKKALIDEMQIVNEKVDSLSDSLSLNQEKVKSDMQNMESKLLKELNLQNEIIWVNSETMSVTITNKKAVSISKGL